MPPSILLLKDLKEGILSVHSWLVFVAARSRARNVIHVFAVGVVVVVVLFFGCRADGDAGRARLAQ